jgi:hypothetical protein
MSEFDEINYEMEEWHDNYGKPNSLLLKEIHDAGFKPIAITVMLCEETFIFKGNDEAKKAAEMFLPEGWWYSLNDWKLAHDEYIKNIYYGDYDLGPIVYWLDKNFEPKLQ